MNLRPHQDHAVTCIRRAPGKDFLLADEVGLGKTRVSCAYAKDFSKTLVVAPLSTIGNWMSEAASVGLDLKQAADPWPDSPAVIVNYERLTKYPENIIQMLSKGAASATRFDLIVWDECHKLKSYKTARHTIWKVLHSLAGKNLYLSATPAQNPLEMKYLCGVMDLPEARYWSWVKNFKGIHQPRWGGFKFNYGNPDDKRKLSGVLNGPRSLRRTPQEIAGWPELNRIIHPIAMNIQERTYYKAAFEQYLARIEAAGKSINSQAEKLVAVGQFKQRVSEIKLPHTLALAEDIIEEGKVVTISCEYLNSANWLQEHCKGRVAVITGSVSQIERESIVRDSMSDSLDVIIFTVKEGINLHQIYDEHRTRIQINHDIRWSAMDQHQTDGRTHRAGRYAPVYWMACRDTIDEKIAKVLKHKMEIMNGMMEGFEITPEQLDIYDKTVKL